MILVDTSVLIDLFSGRENRPTLLLRRLIQDSEPFYLAPPIIREVLQTRGYLPKQKKAIRSRRGK